MSSAARPATIRKPAFKDSVSEAQLNFNESMFVYDEDEYANFDWIMECATPKTTDACLSKLIDKLTVKEIETIYRTYFNIRSRVERAQRVKKKTVGGSVFNKRVYDLLAIADSIHDFAEIDALTKEDGIAHAKEMISEAQVELPKGLTVQTIKDEFEFIRFMKNRRVLEFDSGSVENPLYGADSPFLVFEC